MPTAKLVQEAADDLRTARADSGETTGRLRDAMASHKVAGVHPAAVKLVEAKLDMAKATGRGLQAVATFFAHLDYYRDVLGLTELLKQQGEMFERPEAGEETPAPGTPPGEPDLRPPHLRQTAGDDAKTTARH